MGEGSGDVRRGDYGVRSAARARRGLDAADAEALEHALTLTERERDEARAEVERLRGTNLGGAEERLRVLVSSGGMSQAWDGAWVTEGPALVRSVLLDLDAARAELQAIRDAIGAAGLVSSEHPSGSALWAVRVVVRAALANARLVSAEVGRRTAAEAEVERLRAGLQGIVDRHALYGPDPLSVELRALLDGDADG